MLIDELSRDKPVMTLSAYSIQGKRNHMEDYFDIGYQMKPCDQRRPNEWPYEYFYFGIFDGHGGNEAAEFAKHNLLKFITKQKDFWSNDDNDVMRAIRKGFADTHSAMRAKMPCWNRTSKILPSTAGTTASVLFIRNGKFYTGHVGDSRIVVSQENSETGQWIPHRFTRDHKPESQEESERIQRAGGEVKSKIGVHRVVWKRPVLTGWPVFRSVDLPATYPVDESIVESYQTIPFLAIARSLGDFWSLNPHSGQYIVSPEPDVSCRPISSNDKCILLATDGLWNVMNTSKAVRLLQELKMLKNSEKRLDGGYLVSDNFYDVAGSDVDNHAQSLVYFAYQIWERRRLRSDNITVVVAMLHDILDQFQRTNNKIYLTRASLQTDNESAKYEPKSNGPNQIGETCNFYEEIRLNMEPRFSLPKPNIYDKWQQLEQFLVLPPTIIELEERDYNDGFEYPKVVFPRNYLRLAAAACRKISRQDGFSDSYIYIKYVTDDPADEHPLPTRFNVSGKEVKDASAQATQSIHDFGMPWNLLHYDVGGESETIDEEKDQHVADDKDVKEEQVEEEDGGEVEKEQDDDEEEEEEEENEDDDSDVVHDDDSGDLVIEELLVGSNPVKKPPKREEKSIPQLRCLLNCTPPLRRSARNTYLSVSDNAKRKANPPASAASPKSKRRKSQPNRFNLTRA